METPIPSDEAKEIARQLSQLRGPATEAVMLEDLAAVLKQQREVTQTHAAKFLEVPIEKEDENVIHLGDVNVSHATAAPQQQATGTSTVAKAIQAASLVFGGGGLASLVLAAAGLLGGSDPPPAPEPQPQQPQPTSIVVTPATVQPAPQPMPQPMPQPVQPQQHVDLVPGGMRIKVLPPR